MPKKDSSTTTIRHTKQSRAAVEKIKATYGLKADAEAIRFALALLANSEIVLKVDKLPDKD